MSSRRSAVALASEQRGQGAGRALMVEGIAGCERLWPGRPVRISAQAYLERFYASLGFERVGEPYLEDDIPHLEMLRGP
jgi:ElaA protein